jgi:16S rRNA (guanine966-N2)-methyltransferase
MLAARAAIDDARVLDLFAGSGALAIEALSRGAKQALCVERALAAAKIIRQNAAECGFSEQLDVLQLDVGAAVHRHIDRDARFDLVFADPPYVEPPWAALESLVDTGLLADGAILVAEHARQEPPAEISRLSQLLFRCYGDTAITVYGF